MTKTQENLQALKLVERLKTVQRATPVGDRKESTSEHCFHAVLIADMLTEQYPSEVDAQRVKDLVLYHDLVEVYAGDAALIDTEARKNKEEKEHEAFKQLITEIPNPERYKKLYEEYEKKESIEAKIAKKKYRIEVLINAVNEPRIVKNQGYTEEFLRKNYNTIGGDVPVIDELHEEILAKLKKQEKI